MNKVTSAFLLLSTYLRMVKVGASCPTGWTFNSGNGLCYQFFTTLMNHNEAIDYCYTLDAILATPKDQAHMVNMHGLGLLREQM